MKKQNTTFIKGGNNQILTLLSGSTEGLNVIKPNTTDAALEKHVPVVSINGSEVSVTVGSTLHPMTEAHLIEWIAVETCCGLHVKYLNHTDEPKATFNVGKETVLRVYEYCNLHGVWSVEVK